MMNFDSITWGPNMEVGTTNNEIESLIREIDRDLNIPGTLEFQDDDRLEGFHLGHRLHRRQTAE